MGSAFDFALLDCPARADSVLTGNALRAADTAVLVVECGAFALQGAVRALPLLADHHSRPGSLRVVATLLDRASRMSSEVLVAIQARFGDLAFETAIPVDEDLREAAAYGVPVQELHPDGHAARVFDHLALEVLRHARAASSGPPPVPDTGSLRPGRSPSTIHAR